MSVSNIRDKRAKKVDDGFYVAVVRNTGVASVCCAFNYKENGEEYERGVYYRGFTEAALACDLENKRIDTALFIQSESEDPNYVATEAEIDEMIAKVESERAKATHEPVAPELPETPEPVSTEKTTSTTTAKGKK